MAEADDEPRIYFDAEIAGQRVEADGGHQVPGFAHGVRETFQGTLTGRRMDQGDPPWRWLELGELTQKPEDFADQTVWCEESFVFRVGE